MGLLFQFPLMGEQQVCRVGADYTDPTEFRATVVLVFLYRAVQEPLAAQEQSVDGQETRDHRHQADPIQRLARGRTTHPCQWQVYICQVPQPLAFRLRRGPCLVYSDS